MEEWTREVLRSEKIKIVKSVGNKEAVKIFCKNERTRNEIWEKREELKLDYDMLIDKWMTSKKERRDEMRENLRELKEENRKKGLKIDIEMENDKARIRGEWYRWKEGKWKLVKEEGKEERKKEWGEEDVNRIRRVYTNKNFIRNSCK